MLLSGLATWPPPACSTNCAGLKKLPWHTHLILTSSTLLYSYSQPTALLPLGSPMVHTNGISCTIIAGMSGACCRSPPEPRAAATTADAEEEAVATTPFVPTGQDITAADRLRPSAPGVPFKSAFCLFGIRGKKLPCDASGIMEGFNPWILLFVSSLFRFLDFLILNQPSMPAGSEP